MIYIVKPRMYMVGRKARNDLIAASNPKVVSEAIVTGFIEGSDAISYIIMYEISNDFRLISVNSNP